MFCPKCGKELNADEVNFCPVCGTNLNEFKQIKPPDQVSHVISDKKIADTITSNQSKTNTSKIEKPKEQTINQQKEPKVIDVSKPKKRKWSWGLLTTVAIVGTSIEKYYKDYGDNQSILFLSGVFVSIILYIYLNNKGLEKIKGELKRPIIAGIIAFMLTMFVVNALAYFFFPSIESMLYKKINTENKIASSKMNELLKEYSIIWISYVDEPTTNDDLMNNINIIDKAIPLSTKKDSIFQTTYSNIYEVLIDAQKKNPKIKEKFPGYAELLLDAIKEDKINQEKTIQSFITQKKYYNSILMKQNNSDELYDLYVKTQDELNSSTNRLALLANKLKSFEK